MDKRPHADRGAEAGFEHLLRDTLRRDAGAAGSECLDADTLAAWSEGALAPSERSFVEAHAARCARCQAMLAALARTLPAEPERTAWGFRQWAMMLAPAATAATAMALWFAVEPRRPQREPAVQQMAAATDAPAAAPASPPIAAAPRDAEPIESARTAGAPQPREREAPPLADLRKDSGRRQEVDRLSAESKDESRAATAKANAAAPVGNVSAGGPFSNANAAAAKPAAELPMAVPEPTRPPPATLPPPPPPPAAPKPQSEVVAVTSQSPAIQTAQTSVQQAAASDQQQRAAGFGSGAGRGGGGGAFARAAEAIALAPLVVAPANSPAQWRVVNERIVQHSADKGETYATQYTLDEKSAISAGSSPTPLVAWLVGRGGLVITTSDGRTWRRVPFPEAVDLSSVLAIDARTATVTTSDRRAFTTTDGGASWTAVKR